MRYMAKRWLLGGLATLLLAVGGGWGCDGESGWDHPNRQRYPAPPADDKLVLSLEELQEKWAQEDRRARQMAAQTPERRSTWTALDLAIHHLRRAIEVAVEQTRRPGQPGEEQRVGGGPPSGPDGFDDERPRPTAPQPVEPTVE